jgi:hypothetical protein
MIKTRPLKAAAARAPDGASQGSGLARVRRQSRTFEQPLPARFSVDAELAALQSELRDALCDLDPQMGSGHSLRLRTVRVSAPDVSRIRCRSVRGRAFRTGGVRATSGTGLAGGGRSAGALAVIDQQRLQGAAMLRLSAIVAHTGASLRRHAAREFAFNAMCGALILLMSAAALAVALASYLSWGDAGAGR